MKTQYIAEGVNAREDFNRILKENHIRKYLLVSGFPEDQLPLKDWWADLGIPCACFTNFTANPLYESVVEGIRLFRQQNCEMIVAIGGGSAIDVAKCIKLYSNMQEGQNYLHQEITENPVKLLAIPTTAGTGSESTRYAVVYYNGEKQSVSHESIIPDYVILEPGLLKSLPVYQKKCTMLDALCQAIESMWSVNSTEESRNYSKEAIPLIISFMDAYMDGDLHSYPRMMKASNLAGQAINITQTTAAHAMSYKITSMFGIPHGHAVALCLPHVWEYMNNHPEKCIDPRGKSALKEALHEIALSMGTETSEAAVLKFKEILDRMEMRTDVKPDREQLRMLAASVNPVRLSNHPVELNEETLLEVYSKVFL